jgi:hypothetical protein
MRFGALAMVLHRTLVQRCYVDNTKAHLNKRKGEKQDAMAAGESRQMKEWGG